MVKIVEQGNKEELMNVDKPLETIQFLLAGESFINNDSIFNWSQEKKLHILIAMLTVIERSLGTKPGSFNFLGTSPDENSEDQNKN